MKVKLLLVILSITAVHVATAQDDEVDENKVRKNAVYLELGGNGILTSVNYDRRFLFNNKHGIILRGGVGFYGEDKLVEGSVPEEQKFQSEFRPIVELNYLYGSKNNFLELGIGNNNFMSPSFRVGYRLQKQNGFLFRAGAVIITKGEWWVPVWPGFSFGYSF